MENIAWANEGLLCKVKKGGEFGDRNSGLEAGRERKKGDAKMPGRKGTSRPWMAIPFCYGTKLSGWGCSH